jgi:hypothetical protein
LVKEEEEKEEEAVVLLPRIVVVNKWMTGAGDWVAVGVDVGVLTALLLALVAVAELRVEPLFGVH